jgi:uncharacterized membrane protein YvbJ
MRMQCTTCGATIADKAIVCYRCGAQTAVPQPPDGRETRGGRSWMPVAIAVVVVIVIVVAYLVLHQ